jgi:hypothetical protein
VVNYVSWQGNLVPCTVDALWFACDVLSSNIECGSCLRIRWRSGENQESLCLEGRSLIRPFGYILPANQQSGKRNNLEVAESFSDTYVFSLLIVKNVTCQSNKMCWSLMFMEFTRKTASRGGFSNKNEI